MAASPVESSRLELKPMLGYNAVDDEESDMLSNNTISQNTSLPLNDSSNSSSNNGGSSGDIQVDEEDETEDERLWVKLFPWLLKWSWFRKKRYKLLNENKRLQWDNRAQYVLTLIGYAVGLSNLWRFSYLVAKHGGASFIIPYFVMLFTVGIPLFYMESILGQSLQRGPIKAWYKICPNLWGIGLAGVIVTAILRVYYNVIIGWVLLYFFHSFQHPLPWSKCDGYHVSTRYTNNIDYLNSSINNSNYPELLSCINDSTRYYWYNNAIESSTSINSFGGFSWKLLLCFLVSWVAVYLCIFRGIKSSGKVIYFTATFPYVVMVIVFFRAVTLDGAETGLKFLFIPEDKSVWKDIFLKPQIWLEAASQILFSLGLSLGTIVALSSYSKQTNNCLIDSLIVCFTNSFTSLFASIIVFSIVGFKASKLGTHPKLVSQGPGLAFIVITEAITLMPVPQLWSVLFFIMLFLLGLDNHFGGLEVLITVLFDNKAIKKYRRELVIGIICVVLFLCNIPFCLGNGFYLFQVVDQFTATIPLLVIGCCEVITIAFVYGVYRFFDLVQYPVHPRLKQFWWFVWTFVTPVAMVTILLASLIQELVQPLTYTVFTNSDYYDWISGAVKSIRVETRLHFPDWSQFIGSVLILTSTSCVPAIFIYRLIRHKRARKQTIAFWQLTKERAQWIYQKVKECAISERDDGDMTLQ